MKYISFSLWGSKPMYNVGAIRNVDFAKEHFPGWNCVFYVGDGVSADLRNELVCKGAKVFEMHGNDYRGLFWRMAPMGDIMIIRDCDSRLSARDAAAVAEWEASGMALHAMRTHPNHKFPIMGGLWGYRPSMAPWMRKAIADRVAGILGRKWKDREGPSGFGWRPPEDGEMAFFNADQAFLADIVWPRLADSRFVHDDYGLGERRMPTPPKGNTDFPGNKYYENDNPAYTFWSI